MIILGSQSKARLELIKLYNAEIEVRVSDTKEEYNNSLSLEDNMKNIAKEKAMNLKKDIDFNDALICADTLVVLDNEILGKPKNYGEAFNMIKSYSNKSVDVITGVYLCYQNKEYNFCETSTIHFDEVQDYKIKSYLDENNDYLNIAGALDIDVIDKYVKYSFEGSYSNIIGLPLETISEILSDKLNDTSISTPIYDYVDVYRSSVRSIIVKDNKIGLLKGYTFDKEHTFYMSVGGGYHTFEDKEDILEKEIEEEAGLKVNNVRHLIDAQEYTYNKRYIDFIKKTYHSYYVADAYKEVDTHYIGYEEELLLGVEYFDINEALVILLEQLKEYAKLSYPVFNMTYCDLKAMCAYWGVLNNVRI
ncbi:MAG: Maf family protein [Erysipelotrichales bacterium]